MVRFNKVVANDFETHEIIRMMREWTDLNQEEFGKSIGRTRDSINNIEHGRNRMSLDEFMYLCRKHRIIVILEKR